MPRYIVATHYVGEPIMLNEVTADSKLAAAILSEADFYLDEQPEDFQQFQRWYWEQCEAYIAVEEIK